MIDRQGTAQTHAGGWFALCGVPREVELTVRAGRGADSSGAVEVRVPAIGVRHLTLSIGAPASRSGRIIGHVIDGERRPVASARIALTGGDQETVTTEAGAFAVGNLAVGTQSLAVRAIGYAPRTIIVQVGEDEPARAEVVLERVVALPTMTARDSVPAAHLAQFLQDKKSDASGAHFVQPIRLPGYEAQQSVCSMIAGLVRLDACGFRRGRPSARPDSCEGFLLNGRATKLELTDLDPNDILGVEIITRPERSKYRDVDQRKENLPHRCLDAVPGIRRASVWSSRAPVGGCA